MQEFELTAQSCPACGKKLDATTNLTGQAGPEVGDFTVCLGCASVLRFGPGMKLQRVVHAEIPPSVRYSLAKVRHGIQAMHAYRN